MAQRSTGVKRKPTSGTKRKSPQTQNKAEAQARKQMWAVVLFAVGLLLGFLVFIKGSKIWLFFHNLLLGLFGWSSYLLAPLCIYISILAAKDKPVKLLKSKIWMSAGLLAFISGAIGVFKGLPEVEGIFRTIVELYQWGTEHKGGGVLSLLLAGPLTAMGGPPVPHILIILGIFVFFMLVTGSTLIGIYEKHIARPVKHVGDFYNDRMQQREEKLAQKQFHFNMTEEQVNEQTEAPKVEPVPEPKPKRARFDIDIDIGKEKPMDILGVADLPETPLVEPPLEEYQSPIMEQKPSPEPDILDTFGLDLPVERVTLEKSYQQEQAYWKQKQQEEWRPHPLEAEIVSMENTPPLPSPWEKPAPQPISVYPTAPLQPIGRIVHDEEPIEHIEHIPPCTVPQPVSEAKVPAADPPLAACRPSVWESFSPEQSNAYRLPPITLLEQTERPKEHDIQAELQENAEKLVQTLQSFGVETKVIDVARGPAVTRYELQPSPGVKISKITGLADDIALNLAAAGIRIEAPIPNKAAVGIEVPNRVISVVRLRELIESQAFATSTASIAMALGKDIAGSATIADIAKMPHMLIAGATGSGKSVCINTIVMSILFKYSPEEVKLLMIDPKVVELGVYNGIPHLLVPVVTDPKKAAGALSWAVQEMLKRYQLFAQNSVRDISGYNRLALQTPDMEAMAKVVIIIDELADLMMASPGEVEDSICRLAQMARAAGMHLVIATQRPSVDVITGVIKANIPSRIAFAVSSQVDSRTILDMGGAEKLLGRGDMLFYPSGAAKPLRVQGCFVTDQEVEAVVDFVKQNQQPEYDTQIADDIERLSVSEKSANSGSIGSDLEEEDEMMPYAIEAVVEAGQASTSLLQRRLKLGYARAARMIDQLENRGIVGQFEGSKPRQVLISKDQYLQMKLAGTDKANAGKERVEG